MSLERLTPEDAAILSLESPTVAGHTCKVLVLEPAAGRPRPSVSALRAHVSGRLDAAPRLRRRLAPTPLGLAPPVWVDDEAFDVARHIRRLPGGRQPVDDARLLELAARAIEERLDRAHPLWTIDVVEELAGGRMALMWKLHHVLADGAETMRLGQALLWDDRPDPPPPPPAPAWRPRPAPGQPSLVAAAARDRAGSLAGGAVSVLRGAGSPAAWRSAATELRRLPGTVARDLVPSRGDSPLDFVAGTRRSAAFASVSLDALKRVGHAQPQRTTVNDALLALVTGALAEWISHHGGEPHEIRTKIPVSLHDRHAHPEALANRDSFLCVGLPLSEPDPLVRLRAIAAQTRQRKREHDAQTLDLLFRELRHAPPPIARLGARLAAGPRVFALNVSNVPGPPEPRWVLGAPLTGLWSLAEIGERHALRITAVSLAGTLFLGLTADAGAVADVDVIARGLEKAAKELERAAAAA